MLQNLYRLNSRFVFSEMHHISSDNNMMYSSPSLSLEPLTSDPYHSTNTDVKTAATFHNSHSFRKFSSEPSLTNTPCRVRCGFRERLQSECLEEELPDFRRNVSSSHSDSVGRQIHTGKKSHHRRDFDPRTQHAHAPLRMPLSDCAARLNSSSLVNVPTTQHTLHSRSREEIQSVCIDVFLERYSCVIYSTFIMC